MLNPFLQFVIKNKLFQPKDAILLAVSGGMDSVVMAELFHRAGFRFAIAHCNFRLRGKESDGDELFVKELAKKYSVKFFSARFQTEREAVTKKISIQMAARDLRYEWFKSIAAEKGYKYVATAHHLNDSIETVFINMLRGTGIEGITGIEAKNKSVIRPLLFASREEIEKFAKANKINYREDSSNQSDDYLRNKIRHHVIPVFKSLNPKFEESMAANLSHFAFAAKLFGIEIKSIGSKLLTKEKNIFSISLKALKAMEDAEQVLFELMRPFGFNAVQCAEMLQEGASTASGKVFLSGNYRLVRDRNKLLIEKASVKNHQEIKISKKHKTISTPFFDLHTSLVARKEALRIPSDNSKQWIDADKLTFPLLLRKWKTGDYFFPLGMRHRKKLSDFLIDNKVSLPEKENIHVLTSGNEIVCILGHRIDDRFKITDTTKNIYKVELTYS